MEHPKFTNLCKNRLKQFGELKSGDDTFITNADKGRAFVILEVKYYVKESERQLHNFQHEKLPNDPTD